MSNNSEGSKQESKPKQEVKPIVIVTLPKSEMTQLREEKGGYTAPPADKGVKKE